MKTIISILILVICLSFQAFAQDAAFTVFKGDGTAANIENIIAAAGKADVVFLGELHDDSVGHELQLQIFKAIAEKYRADRKPVLSLEMFERDVQIVIDEYLADKISETHFLSSSRPWGNYKTDYRPIVEFAKTNKFPIIAANAPRRYVNMVTRLGRDSVVTLSPEAKKWLAPLPYADPSEAYTKKFNALMGVTGEAATNHSPIIFSQALWDATMADSINTALKEKDSLVVNLNGSFHSESHLGTVEHLLKYRPSTRVLVVTMRYEEDFKTFNQAKHKGLGDFVILTDASKPRSKRN